MRTPKSAHIYEACIREVEHGTFTPLVFSATGGMADQTIVFYKRLASLLSEKRNEHYAVVMGWLLVIFFYDQPSDVYVVLALLPVDLFIDILTPVPRYLGLVYL